MSYFLVAIFIMVLITSIIAQFQNERIQNKFRIFRHLSFLIPRSTLFAPNPPILDFEILYRDKLADNQVTVWRAINVKRTPLWGIVFWSPSKRWRKQILYLCETLTRQVHYELKLERPSNRIYISYAYVMLAGYVAR